MLTLLLGLFPDRTYSSQNAHHCNARDILQLLFACLDKPLRQFAATPFVVLGPVAQATQHAAQNQKLIQYLLLLESPRDFMNEVDDMLSVSESPASGRRPAILETRVVDFLFSETDKTRQRWKEWSKEKDHGITSDMMRIITNFCIVASATSNTVSSSHGRLAKLVVALDNLTQSFTGFLSRFDVVDQYKIDAVLEVCAQTLPDPSCLESLDRSIFNEAGALPLAVHLSNTLGGRKVSRESFYAEDDDFMDLEEAPNSQLAGGTANPDNDVPRHYLAAQTNAPSLRSCSSVYMHLISSLSELPAIEEHQTEFPSKFAKYLTDLTVPDLLHARAIIKALFAGRFAIPKSDCIDLFQNIQERLIDPQAREYNSSEVAHGLIIDVLTGTTHIWNERSMDEDSQELYGYAEDLYEYYVKLMEKPPGVRKSAHLQVTIANFLIELIMARCEFGEDKKAPSIQTSLYGILTQGDIAAQYYVSQHLPSILDTQPLTAHEKEFERIQAHLPNDPQWIEGIAIRLLVLCQLASTWYTLVRVSIYCIFETAGLIEQAVDHAGWCTLRVAKARRLDKPQVLFKLFAPQIIFSWLASGEIDGQRHFSDIPYSIFQYGSLSDLLSDVETEAIGQAIMLGRKDEVEYLAEQLGTTPVDALNRNFAKAAAYSLSYDTCRGSGRNQSIASGFKLLGSFVGEEALSIHMQENFPQVLGIMLQSTANEDKFEKALSRRPAFVSTAKALAEMNKIRHSDTENIQDFQPSFSAFYLFDLLDRLCRRTNRDSSTFWTPSIFTFVMRSLLTRIHPVLGSLYARSMIRKIRILVALAGEVVYQDYPLQMALQSLRPFLTDVNCAEDAMGIMQYLFEHGARYLRKDLSFLTGISLSILISIRSFLGASQDSTTQPEQYNTTKNKTQAFHTWFTRFLESYASYLPKNDMKTMAFQSITTAASRVRTEGNSSKGTEESKLLLELLDDVRSGRRLLNSQSREVAFNLLCQNFQPAQTARDDVLGSDLDVVDYAAQVWQSCQRPNVGDGYLLWAARVLGRTFSAHGEIKRISQRSRSWANQTHNTKDGPARFSRGAIVQKLLSLRFSDDREEVGLAEDGLRFILQKYSEEEAADLEQIIPPEIVDALSLELVDVGGGSAHVVSAEELQQYAYPLAKVDVSAWVNRLTIALCHVGSRDSIIGSLSRIIQGIEGMAEKMFPYVLHLVLLQEIDSQRHIRRIMSSAYSSWFEDCDSTCTPFVKILVDSILYLRTQKIPKEVTRVDRDKWLELDFLQVAQAATTCGLHKSALLFAETYGSQPTLITSSRRHSSFAAPPKLPTELQIAIYKNLDEPDSYYGVEQDAGLTSVLERLDYEANGVKSLLFRGARMDSQMRRSNTVAPSDSRGTVKSLIMLNMNSITQSLLANDEFRSLGDDIVQSTLHTATKLGQWDIRAPEDDITESSALFKAFQGIHYASDALTARKQLDSQFLATMKSLSQTEKYSSMLKAPLRTLAVLNEADEVLSSTTPDQLMDAWDQMKAREKWMLAGEYVDIFNSLGPANSF